MPLRHTKSDSNSPFRWLNVMTSCDYWIWKSNWPAKWNYELFALAQAIQDQQTTVERKMPTHLWTMWNTVYSIISRAHFSFIPTEWNKLLPINFVFIWISSSSAVEVALAHTHSLSLSLALFLRLLISIRLHKRARKPRTDQANTEACYVHILVDCVLLLSSRSFRAVETHRPTAMVRFMLARRTHIMSCSQTVCLILLFSFFLSFK